MTIGASVDDANPYAGFSYVRVQVSDGIAVLTLSRPDQLNACDSAGHAELSKVLRVVNGDEQVKVVVVCGEGRSFSVGGDLELMEQMIDAPAVTLRILREGREIVQSHIDCDKPVIAAVQGVAMGVGLAFALLCDFIVVEHSTRLADGHVRAALSAGDGGALIWPLAMGLTKAKKYLLTGDWISGPEAERVGLVSEVVEDGTCLDRAMAIARRLADGPQVAIRTTKMALNQWLRLGQLTALDIGIALEMLSSTHEDFPKALHSIRTTREGAIAAE